MNYRNMISVNEGHHEVWAMNMDALKSLIERVYACDNRACFIERETMLRNIGEQTEALPNNVMYRIDRFDNSFAWFRQAIFGADDTGNAVL